MLPFMLLKLEKTHSMKKIIFSIVISLFCIGARSQAIFASLADSFTPIPAPVDKLYGVRPDAKKVRGVITLEKNDLIPLQLYTNFQCTQWFSAEYDSISEPFVLMMMNIPGSNLKLYSVGVGGFTEYAKTVLVLVNAGGYVLDTLEAEVCWGPPALYAKQTRIDANYNITVYSIHTNTSNPLPVNSTIPDFRGWREDTVYRIVNGRFVQTDVIKYKTRTFKRTDLTHNLWDGPDVPQVQKPTAPTGPVIER